jgi:hypothetical protein
LPKRPSDFASDVRGFGGATDLISQQREKHQIPIHRIELFEGSKPKERKR